jgi:hypothetical protein
MKGVKKANLPQKNVSPVESPLPGAKNGKTFGTTLILLRQMQAQQMLIFCE